MEIPEEIILKLIQGQAEIRACVKGNGKGLLEHVEEMQDGLNENNKKTDALDNRFEIFMENHPPVCPSKDEEKKMEKKEKHWKLWVIRGTVASSWLGTILLLLKVFGIIGG